jgi:D-3-phosphoglycerate dehydrogenase / 2-oxoglutarate reductase
MASSDYVILAAALTPETRGLVNAEVLAAAKPGSILINLGKPRGTEDRV